MYPEKANTICILEILKEYSSADNILSRGEIEEKMQNLYNSNIDRRTVYDCIELLINLGYDISIYKENGKGYYLRSRAFELDEIYILQQSLYGNSELPKKTTEDLRLKLQKQLSKNQRYDYRHLSLVKDDSKIPATPVFKNLETLDGAIESQKKVTFRYLAYDYDKQLKPQREAAYTLSPYSLVAASGRFYLGGCHDSHDKIAIYRVDRISELQLTTTPAKAKPADFDSHKFSQSAQYMFATDIEDVVLRCQKEVLDNVINRFGSNVSLSVNDDGSFNAALRASKTAIKFWALQYLEYVELLSPLSLKAEIKKLLADNFYSDKLSLFDQK